MGSTKDLGDIDLAVKRSTDGGKTWDNMITVVDDYDNTCGNPAPVVVESTGRIYLFWCWGRYPNQLESKFVSSTSDGHTRRVFYCYSDDDGQTWSTQYDLTSRLKKAIGVGMLQDLVMVFKSSLLLKRDESLFQLTIGIMVIRTIILILSILMTTVLPGNWEEERR